MMHLKEVRKKRWLLLSIGAVLGGIGGFWYASTIGCTSGSCAITSSPFNSTLYVGFMGGLLFDSFHLKETSKKSDDHE